jgi:ABC-type polysaccharide/polyol phosphate transport system ATPase subunit
MPADDIAISVRNLTKSYRLFGHPGDRIKQFFSLGLKQYHREFTALEDVSFDIKKGETVGIIGRNGSGKSTLLQLICGILKPTAGSITVNGRISALLELGAGFNPEFTGRENVYFQGALMGFTAVKMDARFDEIAAFADIGEFIDQPVRTYSSGMFVRLAFAVAVHVDPEILVIDEALAVGDREFQIKCLERIDGVARDGGTVILVSHALEQVAHHCGRAAFLDKGTLICSGDTASVLAAYAQNHVNKFAVPTSSSASTQQPEVASSDSSLTRHRWYSGNETRWGDGKAVIQNILILQEGKEPEHHIRQARPVVIEFDVLFIEAVARPIFGLTIKSMSGGILYSTNSRQLGNQTDLCPAGIRTCASFKLTPCLDSGSYLLSLGVASDSPQGLQAHDRRYDLLILRIEAPRDLSGELDMQSTFSLGIAA